MSKLSENIGKRFIITTEMTPPVGPDTKEFLDKVFILSQLYKITSVNVIDSPSARLFMSSLGASIILQNNGIEPIFQMVCRDRNSLALESDLISAAAFGIQNVLALTGDHPKRGASDHPTTEPVFELDSTSLMKSISLMNEGTDLSGTKLNAKTFFFVGGALSMGANPIEPEIYKIRRKLSAGASFFQTQAVFDVQTLENFLAKSEPVVGDLKDKILVGVIPLASPKMVSFLNSLPGINVPESGAQRIRDAKDPVEEGVSQAVELIDAIKSLGFSGAHIMPVGKMTSLERILETL